MVECVVQRLPPQFLENTWKQFRLHSLQQAGVQHRLQPPLIPEYSAVEWLPHVPTDPPCKVLQTPWLTGETDEGDGKGSETKNEMLYAICQRVDRALNPNALEKFPVKLLALLSPPRLSRLFILFA